MKTIVEAAITGLVVSILGITSVCCTEAPGQEGEVADLSEGRPAIWQDASGKDIHAAEEMAHRDAVRKLIEKIYRMHLDVETEVFDLALVSKELDAALHRELLGMKVVETKYYDDGSCQSLMRTTLRQVAALVQKYYKSMKEQDRLVTEKRLKEIITGCCDIEITVLGRGALPGSKGLRIIQARRVAELDCYEKFAARVLDIEVTSGTKLRDYVLANDYMLLTFAHSLTGVYFHDLPVGEEGVKVGGVLLIRTVLERIEKSYERYVEDQVLKVEDLQKLLQRERYTSYKETGEAAFRAERHELARLDSGLYHEKRSIIERVLKDKKKSAEHPHVHIKE